MHSTISGTRRAVAATVECEATALKIDGIRRASAHESRPSSAVSSSTTSDATAVKVKGRCRARLGAVVLGEASVELLDRWMWT